MNTIESSCIARSYDEGGATGAIRIATKDGSRRVYAQ